MKSLLQRSLLLGVSAFLILLLSSSVFAFPSIQTNEIIKENWTFFGDTHNSTNTSMADFYYLSPDDLFHGEWIGNNSDDLNQRNSVITEAQVLTDNVLRAKLWINATNVDADVNSFDNTINFSTNNLDQGYLSDGYANQNRENEGISLAAGMSFTTYDNTGSGDDVPSSTPPAVPEPTTIALMIIGLFGMGMLQRWRQNKTA